MSTVNDHALITYTGKWRIGEAPFTSVGKVLSKVSEGLQSSGLPVRSSQTDAPLLTDFLGFAGDVTFTLQLQNTTGVAFSSEDDVVSIVRHWVFQTTGNYPLTDSVPLIKNPSQNPEITGQPGAGDNAPKPQGCIAGTPNNLDGSWGISCWFKNLTSQGLTAVGLLALVVVAGLALAVFAKTQVSK